MCVSETYSKFLVPEKQFSTRFIQLGRERQNIITKVDRNHCCYLQPVDFAVMNNSSQSHSNTQVNYNSEREKTHVCMPIIIAFILLPMQMVFRSMR